MPSISLFHFFRREQVWSMTTMVRKRDTHSLLIRAGMGDSCEILVWLKFYPKSFMYCVQYNVIWYHDILRICSSMQLSFRLSILYARPTLYGWLVISANLLYPQCVRTGDTAVLHWVIYTCTKLYAWHNININLNKDRHIFVPYIVW